MPPTTEFTISFAPSSARSAPVRHMSSRAALGSFLLGAAVIGAAAVTAGLFPLGLSVAIVFLLAGPHNWFEARYMLGRLPARWGKLRGYFVWGLSGVGILTAAFAAIPWAARTWEWTDARWTAAIAVWNTSLLVWIGALVLLRSRQNPRRSWDWVLPSTLALVGLNWLHPLAWSLVLVYAHPLLALWFLDRELGRQKSPWRATYRRLACLVPLALLAIVAWRYASPDLPGDDVLTGQIARHAGAGIVSGVSTHLLVAMHTFLELLHYGVWIVALPLASGAAPWRPFDVPLARRSLGWRRAIGAAAIGGAIVVVALWGAFLIDYPLTRDLYFTIALAHVLAEVPFLLRLL